MRVPYVLDLVLDRGAGWVKLMHEVLATRLWQPVDPWSSMERIVHFWLKLQWKKTRSISTMFPLQRSCISTTMFHCNIHAFRTALKTRAHETGERFPCPSLWLQFSQLSRQQIRGFLSKLQNPAEIPTLVSIEMLDICWRMVRITIMIILRQCNYHPMTNDDNDNNNDDNNDNDNSNDDEESK